MVRFFKKTAASAGMPPGTVPAEAEAGPVKITVLDYDEENVDERVVGAAPECAPYKSRPTVTWINVDGAPAAEVLGRLGEAFGLHPLVVEDIANTEQRPKVEDYGDYLFVVLKMLTGDEEGIATEQVSLALGPNFVLSFQEREGDVFDAVRDRIKGGRGRLRKAGADYLAYALLDAVVDHYFIILEQIGGRVAEWEEELAANPTPETLRRIHRLKQEVVLLRKSVWPLREVVNALIRGETPLVADATKLFLRDLYDHTVQVIEAVETYRDMLAGMLDLYLSTVSHKMNEVMKVLTIIATIFIPLTFIAGIYGMNFRYMPELAWHWSYPLVWGVMLLVAAAMIVFFKARKWL